MIRRLILALALSAGIFPALAQVPPPVPALPDTERRTAYTISASTCACNVNFALYGDSTDYWHWLEVWINGVRYDHDDATHGWTITSPSGSLGSLALPITNAVLTFTAAQTGTVQIVGARRPRRVSQFSENAGVPARALNQALTDIIAQNREIWDKTNDFTGRALISQPGVTLGVLPVPSACAGKFLGFDPTGLIPQCMSGAGSGNVVGPLTSTIGNLAFWNNATGTLLANLTGISATPGGPLTINPTPFTTNQGINITQSGPNSGSQVGELLYNSMYLNDGGSVTGGSDTAAFSITHNLMSNIGGQKYALFIDSARNSAATNTTSDQIGIVSFVQSSQTSGGTNTGAGSKGSMYALNPIISALPGAVNYYTMAGEEIDVALTAGASAGYLFGLSLIKAGVGSGATLDAAMDIAAVAGSWQNGLFLDNTVRAFPAISTTGCIICTDSAAGTIATGIDLHQYTITGNFLRGPNGFAVDGAGDVIVTDGTAIGAYAKSTLFGHSVQIGTVSNHNFVFATNALLAGFFDTNQAFNLGAPGLTQGTEIFNGKTSGSVAVGVQAAAGTYNFNLPTSAGTAGQALLSGGGGSAAQTYGTLGVAGGGTNCAAASGTCLDNITGFASTGILARTASGTYAFRTETGTANEITVTNGSGVAGNPTYSLPSALTFTGKTVTGGTISGLTSLTAAAAAVGGSLISGRTFSIASAGQPAFAFQATGGGAGSQIFGWIYDPGTSLSAPGIVLQTLSDAGGFTSNNSVIWRDGSMTLGSITKYAGANIALETDRGLRLNNQTSSAGAGAGTLTNAPAAGNPTFWLKINVNGTSYSLPLWPG